MKSSITYYLNRNNKVTDIDVRGEIKNDNEINTGLRAIADKLCERAKEIDPFLKRINIQYVK